MSTNRSSEAQEGRARLTIDISKNIHKRLKIIAALQGKSMREYVSELIEQDIYSKKNPNKKTLEAICEVENKKNLVTAKDVKDLFDKLDI